jgi:hypothetical protein
VEEQAKLVCPDCRAAHRVKRLIPGKTYRCKRCGSELRRSEGIEYPGELSSDIASSNLLAAASLNPRRAAPEQAAGQPRGRTEPEADLYLRRLESLSEALAERLERLHQAEIGSLVSELAEAADKMTDLSRDLGESLSEHGELMARQTEMLGDKLSDPLDLAAVRTLSDQIRDAMTGFETARSRHESEIRSAVIEAMRGAEGEEAKSGGQAAERLLAAMDARLREQREELRGLYAGWSAAAERGAGGMKSAIEELAGRFGSLTTRLENAPVPRVEEILPDSLIDAIGRTLEERLVLPVSDAIARQAPQILASVQDQKLVDVVSRSVREAQRPLIREIMHGGGGVPAWLFASVLLPLLLILGYLFLPGELGSGDGDERFAALEREILAIGDGLASLERDIAAISRGGIRLGEEEGIRLREVEAAVKNMYENAMAQAQNAARLETEIRNLQSSLTDRDQKITEYHTALEELSRRTRAYELHLTRLGIAPETIYAAKSE